ncbi:MAG: hypothetical protein K1000chlam1_01602, partial [Candidatus Anoxychlamydiales bacterium]|nr:hypothetical protein [Candidatus Anoxychlamydiales bacterium]
RKDIELIMEDKWNEEEKKKRMQIADELQKKPPPPPPIEDKSTPEHDGPKPQEA